MTQRTINLYDGLEALYYFDSSYYDGGAGEIKDKSGHGRHAQASGGPTIGVEGPDGFEATSFDGSDDQFGTPSSFSHVNESDYTQFCIFSVDDLTVFSDVFQHHYELGLKIKNGVAEVQWWNDSDTKTTEEIASLEKGKYHACTIQFDPSNGRIKAYLNGALETNITVETVRQEKSQMKIGTGGNGDNHTGDIVVAGRWSRALTDAEITYLNNLTAPRRQLL